MRSFHSGWTRLRAALGFRQTRGVGREFRGQRYRRSLRVEALEDRRVLAALSVNTNVDALAFGNSTLTLREAVAIVQAGTTAGLGLSASELAQISTSGGFATNTITFTSALDNATITLARDTLGQIAYSAQAKSLTIDATGRNLTIDANDPTPGEHTGTGIRVFDISDSSNNGASPPSVTLKDLTLKGGDVGQQGSIGPEGGAIRSKGLLTLIDCTITNNSADTGGGVFVEVAGTGSRNVLTIEDCVIEHNEAFTGGGLAIVAGATFFPTTDSAAITRTRIEGNHAASQINGGGGLFADLHGASLTLTDTSLMVNTNPSGEGGGAFAKLDGANLTINRGTLTGNEAVNYGGGLRVTADAESEIQILDSTLSGNTNTNNGGGGIAAVLNGTSTMAIERSKIYDNHSYGGDGGGIQAIANDESQLHIKQSTIKLNTSAARGGGIV